MDRDAVRALCVQQGSDLRRYDIFLALNALLQRLKKLGIICEVWVDGSYLTSKEVPEDLDVSVMVDAAIYENLSAQAKDYLLEIGQLDRKYEVYLDLFVCIVCPKGSTEREIDPPEDYVEQWSLGHDGRFLKGFAVIEVPKNVP